MLFKVYRTLIVWLVWAGAATAIIMGMLLDTELGKFITGDTTHLSGVLIGLFSLGVMVSMMLMLRITSESVEISEIEQRVQHDGLIGIQSTSQRHATHRYFDAVKKLSAANLVIDSEALLQAEMAPYQRRSHTVAVMGNLLITLGLIGTVVGLTITLSSLSGSLDALGHDQALLLEGLRKAMGGMGTAFYTTLMGATFGGLIVRVFAMITEGGIEDIHDRLTHITLVQCAMDTKVSADKEVHVLNHEIEALTHNVRTLQLAFSEAKAAMADFHEQVKQLHHFGADGDDLHALRDSIRLQRHYRLLLKQEVHLLDRINSAWYAPLRKLLRGARRKDGL